MFSEQGLLELRDLLIEKANLCWKGYNIKAGQEISSLSELVSDLTQIEGFPMEYVERAVSNLGIACDTDDKLRLADNYYYEWSEICLVYSEMLCNE